jgi:hypothetical protein
MKYYKISVKSFYGDRISSDADFKDSSKEQFFKLIAKGEMIADISIFDYFYLKSFDEEKYWEWALFDVHRFIGEASWMKGSWLISEKFKNMLKQYSLSQPHFFYSSKLLYKNEKFNYYIFQFTGKLTYKEISMCIDFLNSRFLNPQTKELVSFKNIDDYSEKSEKLYFERDADYLKKKLVLKKEFDFFPTQSFFKDNLVSEGLKQAIEENEITGFEFSELDYEVVVENEK